MTMFSSYWETRGAKDSGYEEVEKRRRRLAKKIEGKHMHGDITRDLRKQSD